MPATVVTIARQKGGAGKTTLAAHLAVAWSAAGRRVAIVDIDPQGSLSQWYRARVAALGRADGLSHAQITGWRTKAEVERLARGHDLVIIDSPPHAETEARIAGRAASLVIVPVQPSPMDLWATEPTLLLAREEKVRALVVLNRVPPRAKLADDLIERFRQLGTDVADSQVGNRIGFAATLLEGRSVIEATRRTRAADEIEALADEILRRAARG